MWLLLLPETSLKNTPGLCRDYCVTSSLLFFYSFHKHLLSTYQVMATCHGYIQQRKLWVPSETNPHIPENALLGRQHRAWASGQSDEGSSLFTEEIPHRVSQRLIPISHSVLSFLHCFCSFAAYLVKVGFPSGSVINSFSQKKKVTYLSSLGFDYLFVSQTYVSDIGLPQTCIFNFLLTFAWCL